MALVLLGCERLSAARNRSAFACFVLACFAKQHGLLLLTAAALFLVLREGRRALPVIAGAALALFGAVLAFHVATEGWFLRYVLYVPAAHGLEPSLLVSYLGVDLALYLPVLCVLAITGGVDHWQRRVLCSTDLLLLAAIAASALGRAHPGGDDNVRLPGYALLALVASSAFCARVHSASPRARLLWYGALGLQAVMLLQSPALYWPTHAQAKALSRLRRELTRCAHGAPSVALDHAGLTGTPFVHTMAWSDLATSRPEYAIVAATAITSALRAPDGPAALAVSTASPALRQLLAANYHVCARLPALRLPTGYRIGPTVVYARGVAAPDDAGGL
jgi:hypothetical protein